MPVILSDTVVLCFLKKKNQLIDKILRFCVKQVVGSGGILLKIRWLVFKNDFNIKNFLGNLYSYLVT